MNQTSNRASWYWLHGNIQERTITLYGRRSGTSSIFCPHHQPRQWKYLKTFQQGNPFLGLGRSIYHSVDYSCSRCQQACPYTKYSILFLPFFISPFAFSLAVFILPSLGSTSPLIDCAPPSPLQTNTTCLKNKIWVWGGGREDVNCCAFQGIIAIMACNLGKYF